MRTFKIIYFILNAILYFIALYMWIAGPKTIDTVIFLSGLAAVLVVHKRGSEILDEIN